MKKGRSMATFAYGRVSTEDQTTENERLEISGLAIRWIIGIPTRGLSGKICASQRSQFIKVLGQSRDGETLAVSKLDRLGRDVLDVGTAIKGQAARKIKVIVVQLGKLDLASPEAKMMLTMLAAVGEMQRDLLAKRTKRA